MFLHRKWLKPMPESGVDCLICAEISRQRSSRIRFQCPPSVGIRKSKRPVGRFLASHPSLKSRPTHGRCGLTPSFHEGGPAHSFSLTHSHSPTRSRSLSHSPTLSLSLSHSPNFSTLSPPPLSHSHSLTPPLSYSLTPPLSHSHSLR